VKKTNPEDFASTCEFCDIIHQLVASGIEPEYVELTPEMVKDGTMQIITYTKGWWLFKKNITVEERYTGYKPDGTTKIHKVFIYPTGKRPLFKRPEAPVAP
jgi:hypothetical protein